MNTDIGPRPSYFVDSLGRGLSVLAAFEPGRIELSLADIASVCQVTNPSALRIGYTLVQLGYLTRNPVTKGYRLGPKTLTLGLAALSSMTLLDIAEPYLIDLRDRTDENVKCAIMQGNEVVYIAHFRSRTHPSNMIYVGTRLPAHMTSTGRALLAQLSDSAIRAILDSSPRDKLTEHSITDSDAILREIQRARSRGYAVNDQGLSVENRSVGAALLTARGVPVGALNIAVGSGRMSLSELENDLAPQVVETARLISSVLPAQLEGFLESGEAVAASRYD